MWPKSLSCALVHSGTVSGSSSDPFLAFFGPSSLSSWGRFLLFSLPSASQPSHSPQPPLPPLPAIIHDIISHIMSPLSLPLPLSLSFPLPLSSLPPPFPGTSLGLQSRTFTSTALAFPLLSSSVSVNWTVIPLWRVLPSLFEVIELSCMKTSSEPSSGLMNPNFRSSTQVFRSPFCRPACTSGIESDSLSSSESAANFFLPLPAPFLPFLPLPVGAASESMSTESSSLSSAALALALALAFVFVLPFPFDALTGTSSSESSSISTSSSSAAALALALALALAFASAFGFGSLEGGTKFWMAATAFASSSYLATSSFRRSYSLSRPLGFFFAGSLEKLAIIWQSARQ
mmetsp:Transcript_53877/g.153505  ORF Transcript_53877/g.153505 Transcript_53877/m.153505 type:complete len:346 (+) Transcript_53877:332-1369(+)